MTFARGQRYARQEVKRLVGARQAKGGNWDTGIVEHEAEFFIFANVGSAGRTGHQYENRWDGPLLRWSHKAGSRLGWRSVKKLLHAALPVHVFWRSSNDEHFIYAGDGVAVHVVDATPVEIIWAFDGRAGEPTIGSPEEDTVDVYEEGRLRRTVIDAYERDARARYDCIEHHGVRCTVCGMVFEEVYGPLGAGFIHVHHLRPLASHSGGARPTNPIADLRPVCPNCHCMLHRRRPPLSIDELRTALQTSRAAERGGR